MATDQMSRPILRNNLRASAIDGAAYGGMVGLGETYLAPFALAVGIGEVSAGLVASLPMIAGGILQLVSLRAVHWIGSERRWILLCASLQGLAFLPLLYGGIVGDISFITLLLIASVYWGAGLASGPAWNTWIESIVPAPIRPQYFAARGRLAQLTTLVGFLLGGAILTTSGWMNCECQGFAMIFALACVFRLSSVYWLTQHQSFDQHRKTGVNHADADQPHAIRNAFFNGGRLLLFLVMLQGMVQLAGPFFTPFMLTELGFSYVQFVALTSVTFIAKVLSMSIWGRLSKRHSARTLLWIGSVGVVPISALWMVSQHYVWLILLQALGGVMWAAYELGFFLMFFEALPRQRRVRMLTIYNFGNTLAISVGALVGAWILQSHGASREGYLTLFGLSSLGRSATLFILASASLESVPVLKIGVRVLGIRPGSGSLDSPVLSSLDDAERYPLTPKPPRTLGQ